MEIRQEGICLASCARGGGLFCQRYIFLGRIPGTIGEVSTIALLIGARYLVVRKVISLRIPLVYIAT
ncbi:MAG: RnfABCDGE type electron transport complex subunit D, partial [Selenomonas noxia]